jgi:hypothetical protein
MLKKLEDEGCLDDNEGANILLKLYQRMIYQGQWILLTAGSRHQV